MAVKLGDILRDRPLEEIEATLDYFEASPRSSSWRYDPVKALSSYLSGKPEQWLGKLTEGDLRVLQKLCQAGPDTAVEMIPTDYPMVVEVLHLADYEKDSDPDLTRVSLPRPLYELIAPRIDSVIAQKERDGSFATERLALGALHAFGVVPLTVFVDCIFGHYDTVEQMREFADRLVDSPVMRLYQEQYRGVTYMVSPDVEDPQKLLNKRRKTYKSIRSYAAIAQQAFAECGKDAPFCWFGSSTPEGKALAEMLYKIGYEGDELQFALHTVWINSQYEPDDKNLELLLSPITHRDADIISYDEFTEFAQIIIRYANSVPKWLLKGASAADTGLMTYSLPAGYFQDEFEQFLEGFASDEILQYFDAANQVRPVFPDDPCPCGSGLSYRLCHGKYVS